MVDEPFPAVEEPAPSNVPIEKVRDRPESGGRAPVYALVPPPGPFGLGRAAPPRPQPAASPPEQLVGVQPRVADVPLDPSFERPPVLVQQIAAQPRRRPVHEQVLVHPAFF